MAGVQIGIAAIKPSFVLFETVEIEDRDASIKEKRYVGKDVDMAYITPPGSKDRIPQRVDFWFEKLAGEVKADRYPQEWLNHYREAYKAWKSGQELPDSGTPLKNWSMPSPAQMRTLRDLHITTVEQVAQANAELIGRLGMGGVGLKQAAQEYLLTVNDLTKQAATIEKLNADNAALQAQLAELAVKVAALSAKPDAGANVGKTSGPVTK